MYENVFVHILLEGSLDILC